MKKNIILSAVLVLLFLFSSGTGFTKTFEVTADTRCPVCGMFVAKYPHWLTRLQLTNGSSRAFDGVKDMMAFYFSPRSYGEAEGVNIAEVLVKDYYSQSWIDGKTAFYVIGSDVLGPMGHELISFTEKAAAENFLKDHHGNKILLFDEISPQLIDRLRKGHRMKGHRMNGHKK